ncbi:MAG: 16S rRNA (guanine(527)-N(7))-methyltransferase RsmG [Burkholderiales bacterium 66-5]|uniref:16S rRNA (guanine(527)-N(7))-methyltransferase RsmG n=1 Tax=Comamonas badia TaxID=265291 RepID=UPI0004134BC6|nr:MAG: 16S rRNA (guanine(527)-N(7))-methyltransferase RsmG [Burkholderiales bacterium 66-5]
MTMVMRGLLLDGLGALELQLDDHQIDRLLEFLALLQRWNRVYNLTAVREPRQMLTHHLLDSLAAVPPLRRYLVEQGGACARLLDVGSGGGLPGVVFAVCQPGLEIVCVDAVAKKAAFVQQAAASLQLRNLRGMHARVQELQGPFDVVSSRAFASLADFTAWSRHLLAPGGVWLAMKGKPPDDEMAALPAGVAVFHVEPLRVPQLDAERCIVWMRPA